MLALSLVCSFHLISDITEWYDSSEVPGRKLFLFYWLSEWNMKRIQRQVEKKIVISSFLKDYYKNENVILLPPLIDLSDNKWTMSSSVLPPFSGIRLIYAGSTNKSKDLLAIMIKAVISCVKKGLILQLIIVGIFDKDKYDFISKKDFAEFGKNILFLGKIDQTFVPQYYLSSDFSLFVRRHSRKNMAGFPTKFVESMAACTPVITNRTSDIEMYLKHNENGLLVDDFTESELSKVLVCISQFDKAKIQRMKVGAYKCAMKNFDYKCYVNLINSFMK